MRNNNKGKVILSCKDHTVSGEVFELLHDENYDMLITSPQPELDTLSKYYQSEDYISHTDAKRSLFEKIYHLVKSFALHKKLKLVNSETNSHENILDIGAGTGDFLKVAKDKSWNVSGTEPDLKARSLSKEKGILLLEETSLFENHFFDAITMWHVLEHVPDVKKQLKELKRLLKPDGTIFIAVPNFKSLDAKKYKEFWAAYDVPRHLWHFSKTSISKLAEDEGLKVDKILPMKFDAYYVSLLSEKYKNGKMNVFKAFFNGFHSNLNALSTKEYSSLIYVLKNS
ncbi:methyltransferase domain-containing protein [Flavobacteriaceae bacterium R38]|nr:methyltransferase domain-containing protein [Flavobacteriaceae bacterium R38]